MPLSLCLPQYPSHRFVGGCSRLSPSLVHAAAVVVHPPPQGGRFYIFSFFNAAHGWLRCGPDAISRRPSQVKKQDGRRMRREEETRWLLPIFAIGGGPN